MSSPEDGSAPDEELSQEQNDVETTVFNKLGSWTALNAAVDIFYTKVLADPLLAPFFQGIPMKKLRQKQLLFMSFAFGGTGSYYGKQIGAAHRQLILKHGLNLAHFDAVAGHFVSTLTELGVSSQLISEAAGVVLTTRPLFDPEAVVAEERAAYEAVNAPVVQSLRTLQAEIAGTDTLTKVARMEAAAADSDDRPMDTQGTAGIRVSALAEIFAPQVLSKDKAQHFTALRASKAVASKSESQAAVDGELSPASAVTSTAEQSQRLTPPHQQALRRLRVGSRHSECGHISASPAADALEVEDVRSSAPCWPTGEDKAEAEEAKRQRRAMLKQVLRGIGLLPFVPTDSLGVESSPTTPTIRTATEDRKPQSTAQAHSRLITDEARVADMRDSASAPAPTAGRSSASPEGVRGSLNGKGVAPAVSTRSLVGHWLETITASGADGAAGGTGLQHAASPSGAAGPAEACFTLADLPHLTPNATPKGMSSSRRASISSSSSASSGVSFIDSDEDLTNMLGASRAAVRKRNATSVHSKKSLRVNRNSSRLSQSTDRTSAGGASCASGSTRLLRYTPSVSAQHDPGSPIVQPGMAGSSDWATAGPMVIGAGSSLTIGSYELSASPLATLEEVSEALYSQSSQEPNALRGTHSFQEAPRLTGSAMPSKADH